MAKKQRFADKVDKKTGEGEKHIKVIRTDRAALTGALRFSEEMVRVPEGKSGDAVVKELLAKEA